MTVAFFCRIRYDKDGAADSGAVLSHDGRERKIRRMKRSAAFAALCFLLLTGCAPGTGPEETAAEEAAQANAQQQALERAEQAGLLAQQQEPVIAAEQAETQIAALLEEYGYTAARTEDTLSVGDGAAAHDYYVFAVRDAAGGEAGKLAVDCVTGEAYHYLGDGVLEALSAFPTGQPHGWPGVYAGPVQRTLEIMQTDEQTIAYAFSDGTAGTASVAGYTAKSADGEINFLLADRIITVAGGGLTGNYTIQPQTAETLPSAE